jgi:predicted DNA-binding transcriptional regulator AlpA
MTGRRMTLREIRQLPATVDVPTAASALGIGKSTLYEAIKAGVSPVKVLTVQRRVVVLTADLVRVLEGGSSDAPAA